MLSHRQRQLEQRAIIKNLFFACHDASFCSAFLLSIPRGWMWQYILIIQIEIERKSFGGSFYPRETQCQSESATSVINVTNRFHNALLVWNWFFFSISKQRRLLHRLWFCPSSVQLLNTFFPNRFAFLREICVIRCSPYDTFVFSVHRRRLWTIEVFNKFRWIWKRPNDTESLGCMAIADYFSSQLLWK